MELDRSADPPTALWVSTTKSTVNKWVSSISEVEQQGFYMSNGYVHIK